MQTTCLRGLLFAFGLFLAQGMAVRAQLDDEIDRRSALVRVVERCREGVVSIKMMRRGNYGLKQIVGCGVIVDARGYILTNHHVIASSEQFAIVLLDGTELPATLFVEEKDCDLAILRVQPTRPLKELHFGPSSDIMVGETVIAIGHPHGYQHTVTTGIVSATGRELTMPAGAKLTNMIQISAAINPGNSGGALLNINGELIGINSAIRGDAQGLAFAINSDQVQAVLARHLSAAKVSKVDHGMKIREEVLPHGRDRQRVVIEGVAEHSPASDAGLRAGDVVVKLGDRPVGNRFDVERALWNYQPGQSIQAVVSRGGNESRVNIKLCSNDPASPARLQTAATPR
jgi:serine protease Do